MLVVLVDRSESKLNRLKMHEQHLTRFAAMKGKSKQARTRRSLVELALPFIAIGSLYWFSASFFLAKRSLPQTSTCNEASNLLQTTLGLSQHEASGVLPYHSSDISQSHGCWLDRRIDSLVVLVVDALRFDFAQHHLPMSVGARITNMRNQSATTSSQLLQFVADPPTVTMQRLKGLTTGSLPTFADISGNFGGSSIDEDSWIQQLKTTPHTKRGLQFPSQLGFVGDDTWVDLFPTQFDVSYPLPSFNTRDLDTVDNGCLDKLPGLLSNLRTDGSKEDELEVIVAHFLGVDHVGHTYGPHNRHMSEKLNQMDAALSATLEILDESKNCHLALIFGDHGMTEDGNHGGGTDDEINAALFVHFSPACGEMAVDLTPQMGSSYIQDAFQSIHQIDLVPTISILLGLPIPYANIGGIVPSLLGAESARQTAAALALNAAQLWRYFTIYSSTANKLPNLPELEAHLQAATAKFKEALAHVDADDSNAFYEACGLFKIFLVEAAELGHKVWTRFDSNGMLAGAGILLICLILSSVILSISGPARLPPTLQWGEIVLTIVFVFFQSGMLTFSNSYIEAEQKIVMFMMAVIGLAIYIRMHDNTIAKDSRTVIAKSLPLILPILARIGECLVSGHGMDPSIRLHLAHNAAIFLVSLGLLGYFRIRLHRSNIIRDSAIELCHTILDCGTIVLIGISWIEKRNVDTSRNGYLWSQIALAALFLSTPLAIAEAVRATISNGITSSGIQTTNKLCTVISKIMLFIVVVTGPSTASTMVIFSIQMWILFSLVGANGRFQISSFVLATLWRLVIRHTFFATNHACAFNRLQYSAAFVSSMEFSFVFGGIQLFMNTFGWEIVGLCLVWLAASRHNKPQVWKWYGLFQLLETSANCISVSILRRHLMVWAIYAPRFLFSGVFFVLHGIGQIIVNLMQ